MHGVLSHHMLEALSNKMNGLDMQLGDVHRYVCAILKRSWPKQNPVLFGNKNQGFFGHGTSRKEDTEPFVFLVATPDQQLQLQAGQAHGVCVGDRFTIHPLNADTDSLASNRNGHRVTTVNRVTQMVSFLEPLATPIETVWVARATTRVSLGRLPVRLAPELPFLHQLSQQLKRLCINVVVDEESRNTFHVLINRSGDYEILRETGTKLAHLPSLAAQDQENVSYLCKVLYHVVRFELGLQLTSTTLTHSDMARLTYEGMLAGGMTDESVCVGLHNASREMRRLWREQEEVQAQSSTKGKKPDIGYHSAGRGRAKGSLNDAKMRQLTTAASSRSLSLIGLDDVLEPSSSSRSTLLNPRYMLNAFSSASQNRNRNDVYRLPRVVELVDDDNGDDGKEDNVQPDSFDGEWKVPPIWIPFVHLGV